MSADQVHSLPPLPPRRADSHKGDHGRVLVVAGSPGMAGAAVLAARGALRAGSGLVTVAIPAPLSAAVTAAVPEATQRLLPEPSHPAYADALRVALPPHLNLTFDSLAAGPGIGTSEWSRELLSTVLQRHYGPQVLDADALNLIASGLEVPPFKKRIWTPHPGEFQRLMGYVPHGDDERIEAGARFVDSFGGVLLLKGHRSVVHDGKRFFINLTGNPGMATGGSGDVLTGVLASLVGQGFDTFSAACLGAHLHGLAGDLAVRALGVDSVIAGDIAEFLPNAFTAHRGGT